MTLELSLADDGQFLAERDAESLDALAAFVLAREGASGHWEVTVALVDDDRSRALHREFMGVDAATDVMTFPLESANQPGRGGDIVISVDHARERSAEWGLTPSEEVRFLVAHGLLHLLGWRDETEEQRQRMLQRQQMLIDDFGRI